MIVAFSGKIVAEKDLKKPERPLFGRLLGHSELVGWSLFFKSETMCEVSLFYWKLLKTHVNKTHFQKQSFALSLVLKVRVFETRKWPIDSLLALSLSDRAWRVTRVTYLQMIERDSSAQYVIIDADQMRKLRFHFDASTFVSEAESSFLQGNKRRQKEKKIFNNIILNAMYSLPSLQDTRDDLIFSLAQFCLPQWFSEFLAICLSSSW